MNDNLPLYDSKYTFYHARLLCGMNFLQRCFRTDTTWKPSRSEPTSPSKVDNAPAIPLVLRMSMGGGDYLTSGLLFMTGMLWGCTNPFIRAGTRGLRDVRANTVLGQILAELTFLMSNWKYVLPWLVNQAGSLSYLLAVQRAPLSLCVPAANALAFAFTAVTGAAFGKEDPLDRNSILGIAFIIAGTALCCWDKTE